MKKILLIALACLMTATAAMAQGFRGEWYIKGSDKLYQKMWHSPEYTRYDSYEKDDNGNMVIIIEHRTTTATVIDHVKKTCIRMTDLKNADFNRFFGYDLEVSRSAATVSHGIEEVEGRDCIHYETQTSATYKTGGTDEMSRHYWVFEPLKTAAYNGTIQEDDPQYGLLVMRNISMGPQPASLFKIPADYQVMEMPSGGFLELMTGKSREQNTKTIDSTANALGDIFKQIQQKTDENKGKSQEEQVKSLLELMEQLGKK